MTSSWALNLDHLSSILSLDASTGLVTVQAGIRLFQLSAALATHGLALPNLGSIDQQSLAGALATGTHGSTLQHGTLAANVRALKLMLSNGSEVSCSLTTNPELFAAALVSLGALGVLTEVTFQAVPEFRICWRQAILPLDEVLVRWEAGSLWSAAEFVRVWWLPYTRRAILWQADKTSLPLQAPPKSWYGSALGRGLYQSLLWVANYIPALLPRVEQLVFGLQYGFSSGATGSAVEPGRTGLLMDCLYSQFVNEWAIPLSRGPEAIRRLSAWLNREPEAAHRIPVPILADTYVHAPIEVRVSRTHTGCHRGLLDASCATEDTLYLNATLYRPFGADPPGRKRYYEAFEWLMADLGGRPHWAKNFVTPDREFFERAYGKDLLRWRAVRREVDPLGMFTGEYHRRYLLGQDEVVDGERNGSRVLDAEILGEEPRRDGENGEVDLVSATSEESFDLMAKAEAE